MSNAQTYETFLRGQAEKAQYGVVIIPARTALDMADFIERMRANDTDTNVGSTISRDAAIDAVKHAWAKGLEPTQYLEELPSAQPEIIRCKDCKYYEWTGNRIPEEQTWWCYKYNTEMGNNDYCSYGERRDGDGNG